MVRQRLLRASGSTRAVGVLADDLYVPNKPWPRRGRPVRHDPSAWNVMDDWPEDVPVGEAEVAVFEAWFGDVFDELLGPGT